jgi:hypothetical protein
MPDIEPCGNTISLNQTQLTQLNESIRILLSPLDVYLPHEYTDNKSAILNHLPTLISLLQTNEHDTAIQCLYNATLPDIQKHQDFYSEMMRAIDSNLDRISGNNISDLEIMLVDRLTRYEPENVKAKQILDNYAVKLEDNFNQNQTLTSIEAGIILLHGNETIKAKLTATLTDKLEKYTDGDCLVTDLTRHENQNVVNEINKVIGKFLGSRDLDGKSLIETWWDCSSNGEVVSNYFDYSEAVKINIATINRLEKFRKGVCIHLCQNFGIRSFGRYPDEVLKEMIEGIHKPYILFVSGLSDHNAAFYEDKKILNEIRKKQNKFQIICIEVGSCSELNDRFEIIKKQFGQAEHGILAGHGDTDGLTLNNKGKYYERRLTRMYFLENSKIFNETFKPGGTVILFSCSTAKDKSTADMKESNFAKIGSHWTDLDFIGPDDDSGVTSINIIISDEKLLLIPVYNKAKAVRYRKGEIV